MYKFIDLFSGIGGFRIALEKKGMECVFSSDIDDKVMLISEETLKCYSNICASDNRQVGEVY